jgi:hypothetical protein
VVLELTRVSPVAANTAELWGGSTSTQWDEARDVHVDRHTAASAISLVAFGSAKTAKEYFEEHNDATPVSRVGS